MHLFGTFKKVAGLFIACASIAFVSYGLLTPGRMDSVVCGCVMAVVSIVSAYDGFVVNRRIQHMVDSIKNEVNQLHDEVEELGNSNLHLGNIRDDMHQQNVELKRRVNRLKQLHERTKMLLVTLSESSDAFQKIEQGMHHTQHNLDGSAERISQATSMLQLILKQASTGSRISPEQFRIFDKNADGVITSDEIGNNNKLMMMNRQKKSTMTTTPSDLAAAMAMRTVSLMLLKYLDEDQWITC